MATTAPFQLCNGSKTVPEALPLEIEVNPTKFSEVWEFGHHLQEGLRMDSTIAWLQFSSLGNWVRWRGGVLEGFGDLGFKGSGLSPEYPCPDAGILKHG